MSRNMTSWLLCLFFLGSYALGMKMWSVVANMTEQMLISKYWFVHWIAGAVLITAAELIARMIKK